MPDLKIWGGNVFPSASLDCHSEAKKPLVKSVETFDQRVESDSGRTR